MQSSKEFIGNFGITEKIITALRSKVPVLLSGCTGSGKSSLSSILLKEEGYSPLVIHGSSAPSSKEALEELLRRYTNNKSIDAFFSPAKRAILIDDLDILYSQLRCATVITPFVNENKVPMIFTINSSEERKIGDLKKKFTVIKLAKPSVNECFQFFTNGKKSYNDTHEKLIELIRANKCDIRAIQANLEQTASTGKTVDCFRTQFSELGIFDTHDRILSIAYPLESLLEIPYSENKVLYYMLLENVPCEFRKNRASACKKNPVGVRDDYLRLLDTAIATDSIDNFVNSNMTYWELLEITSHLRMGSMHSLLNAHKRNEKGVVHRQFQFCQTLTKSAMRYSFMKKQNTFVSKYNLPKPIHAMYNVCLFANLRQTGKTKKALPFDRSDIDVCFKYGTDYELLTNSKVTTWRKKLKETVMEVDEPVEEYDVESFI
jgi:hypothetical protein